MRKEYAVRRDRFEYDTFPHLGTLWKTALWLTMRKSFAEKLVLKTMTRAYMEWQESGGLIRGTAWLFRILTREFFSVENLKQQRQNSSLFYPEDIMAPTGSERVILLTGISDIAVKGAIARIRPFPRLMLLLQIHEKFSYTEIAYITDLPKNSVKEILNRLRRLIPGYILVTADYLKETSNSQLPDGKNDGKIVRDRMKFSSKKASLSNREYPTIAVTESWENEGGAIVNKSRR